MEKGKYKMILTTTLQALKGAGACPTGYRRLAKHLGGCARFGMNTEINLLTILDSNGVQDMLWSLRATRQDSRYVAVQLAIAFAEESLSIYEDIYPKDNRPRAAIAAAKDYLAADSAASAASAAYSAASAAYSAASAAYSAAYSAARSAAYSASSAADSAASAADSAADSAAYSAASAVYSAVYSAARAARAASAADSAADSAAVERQGAIIRTILKESTK